MREAEAARAGRDAFAAAFGGQPEGVFAAPGRVNLIGEHTDYQQGLCLPMAIDRQTVAAARLRSDRRIHVYSATMRQWASGPLDDLRPGPRGWWGNYVAGVLAALEPPVGLDLVLLGDLPVGAGLSSSASLEMAVATAVNELCRLGRSPRDLALAGQSAENRFAGVSTGIMDQFASALGQPAAALLLDVRTQRVEPVRFDPEASGLSLLVVDTRAERQLVSGGYEQRFAEARAAAAAFGVDWLRDIRPGDVAGWDLEPVLRRRARHICTENERVLGVVAAARRQDWEVVGRLFYASHASLRDDYEVSHPALDLVVETAGRVPGVLGARLTGAGFGGSAIVLLRRDAEPAFLDRLGAAWGRSPSFRSWRVLPAAGAHRLEVSGADER